MKYVDDITTQYQYKKMQDFHKPCILFFFTSFSSKNKEKEVYD